MQLDRLDNEKGYSKGNVVWATATTNARNKRNTAWVVLYGEKMSLPELAERCGLDYHAAFYRYQSGWSPERIFETPSAKKKEPK